MSASGTAPRRSVLCVPASEPRKIAKALALDVDEVVVDLEDAVAPAAKEEARANVATLSPRATGGLAVRVNAVGTPWHKADVAACAANPAVDTIVLPKAERPGDLVALADRLASLDGPDRPAPLGIQALLESPLGIHHAVDLARASDRVVALILGYADLSATMGRRIEASWQFAQDAVVLAARVAGIQAIDGPLLTIAVDDALVAAATSASDLGFDGKWVIHPAQAAAVQNALSPTPDEVAEAREILAVLESAEADGRGALQWRGRMLDEAVAVRARRILDRTTGRSEQ